MGEKSVCERALCPHRKMKGTQSLGMQSDSSAGRAGLQHRVQAPAAEVGLCSYTFCSQTNPCLEGALTKQQKGSADVLWRSKADPRRSSSPCSGPAPRAGTARTLLPSGTSQGGRLQLPEGLAAWEANWKMSTLCKGSPSPCRTRSRSHKPEVHGQRMAGGRQHLGRKEMQSRHPPFLS